jgi:Flp pilus assembly protein TadD
MALSPDSPASTPPSLAPRRGRLLYLLVATGLVLLLAGTVAGILAWRREAPPVPPASSTPADPRLDYTGPFRNVHPSVRYVGDAACAGCHADIAATYREHPMGRSLTPVARVIDQAPHAGRNSRFTALGSTFEVVRQGNHLLHRQTCSDDAGPLFTLDLEADLVVGSGTRGYSYLSERGGYLFQTSLSWFSQKHVWDLSPGFGPALLPGRPIPPDCLFCHANRTHPREGTVNGYETPVFDGHAIGCERCHGPGALHVQERTASAAAGPIDHTIVHPGKLPHALREAVCEQCHLAGEARVVRRGRGLDAFRPGMSLDAFLAVLVRERRAGSGQKAVNHVEQMYQSRCFQGSSGKDRLGCVSCHDPHVHVRPERRVDYYRGRCQACHQQRRCTLPREVRLKENRDSCIDCHMPPYSASDIAHTAATDHRIVRRRTPPAPAAADSGNLHLLPWRSGHGPRPGAEGEDERDLGIALVRVGERRTGDRQALARQAALLLDKSTGAFPDDVSAWEARGQALVVLGRQQEALDSFEAALARAPGQERSLLGAARLAQGLGLRDRAVDFWRRAVAVNPWAGDYHGNLAVLLAHDGRWKEATEHCRTWLRLNPASREAHHLWSRCLFQKGDRDAARAALDRSRRLR